MEILETFPPVFCFLKLRINENGGNKFEELWYFIFASFTVPTCNVNWIINLQILHSCQTLNMASKKENVFSQQ